MQPGPRPCIMWGMGTLLRLSLVASLALVLTSCEDPFGRARMVMIAETEMIAEECEQLVRITGDVDALEGAQQVAWTDLQADLGALRARPECAVCAALVGAAAGQWQQPDPVAVKRPSVENPLSKDDPVAEIEQRRQSWKTYRDGLRARAEQRDRFERSLLATMEARGVLGGPACAEAACGVGPREEP